MSNDFAISPPVMINRIVDRQATPPGAELAKVAMLRARLESAVQEKIAENAAVSPDGKGEAPVVDSGAAVDRLI
ncbi:hypothetical protein ABIB57_003164 [Devosia sp. UYZn731]|uniref:hypothetical protein n=1 Tax=Devosia sp. UYZn731 TaxID=3156345 RepID=UPI00339301A8